MGQLKGKGLKRVAFWSYYLCLDAKEVETTWHMEGKVQACYEEIYQSIEKYTHTH